MKKLLLPFIFISCSYIVEPYNEDIFFKEKEFYWYYNPEIFKDIDSCQVVGVLKDEYNYYSINRKCKVSNDTVYIVKKYKNYKFFIGNIYTNTEIYRINIEFK